MAQKARFTSQHLIAVVLIQLILVDVFLIAFFVQQIRTKNGDSARLPGNDLPKLMQAHKVDVSGGRSPYLLSKFRPLDKLVKRMMDSEKRHGKSLNIKNTPFGENAVSRSIAGKGDPLRDVYSTLAMNKSVDAKRGEGNKLLRSGTFIATSYDLSFASCGKHPAHPAYGITFSGKKAVKGRTIAVDPKVIPLGSRVHIEFPSPYTHMTGWYVAEDIGSAVKGNIIDVFLGESAFYEMEKFGSRIVKARIFPPETYSSNQARVKGK